MDTNRRFCLTAGASIALSITLHGCTTAATIHTRFDAIVDAGFSGKSGTASGGVSTYKTLKLALDAAPAESRSPWRIHVRNGRYYEKLDVVKPNIHLVGESRAKTVLTFDAYAGQVKPGATGSRANWTTFGCATLSVHAPDFAATNLTIDNGFDYLGNDGKPATDATRTNDPQAVALMTTGGSDRARFTNVTITGHQDTLFVDAGRNHFRNCTISGGVDFIFGAAQAVFETCEIVTRPRTKLNVYPIGYITAPSTQIRDQFGLVFLGCKLLRESALVPANSTALGRPWHPAVTMPDGRYADPNAIGSSVFIECFMDDHIMVDGWFSMTGQQKSGPDRTVFLPEDSRFFEYKNTGPGALINSKRRQLTDAQAVDYTAAKVLRGWQL